MSINTIDKTDCKNLHKKVNDQFKKWEPKKKITRKRIEELKFKRELEEINGDDYGL
jgi:hypothetical protein